MILKGKTVIITGIGPGMGRKMAAEAAKEGANVVMVSRSDYVMKDVVTEIEAAGGTCIAIQADVSKPEDCQRVAAEAVAKFGRIDGLVNSAYYHPPMIPILENDSEDIRQAYEVIVIGALNMVRAVLPSMKDAGGGSIVNIGTMAGRKPMTGEGGYAAAKMALAAVTRQLAHELGQYNIRVNITLMGWLMGQAVDFYYQWKATSTGRTKEEVIAEAISHVPLGRIPPDGDCGKAALMLLSDYASEITGASIDVNGGEYMSA